MSAKATSKSISFSGISLILGVICAFIKLISVVISGSPFEMIHKLDPNGIIPSVWIWNLCGIILYFLAGCAAGIAVNETNSKRLCGTKEASAYKVGLFFISLLFLGILHYPLFFVCERLLISLLVAVISVICSVMCAVLWSKISSFAALIMTSFAFYSVYVAFINICILMSI